MTPAETRVVRRISGELQGNSRVIVVDDLDDLAEEVSTRLAPDVLLNDEHRELFYNHRRTPSRDIYFLTNLDAVPVKRKVSLRATGSDVTVWNPNIGEVAAATSRVTGGRTIIELTIAAHGGVFVVIER